MLIQLPYSSLQLTRLACGKGRVPHLRGCATMRSPMPEPPAVGLLNILILRCFVGEDKGKS
jgi:hypothetical protein